MNTVDQNLSNNLHTIKYNIKLYIARILTFILCYMSPRRLRIIRPSASGVGGYGFDQRQGQTKDFTNGSNGCPASAASAAGELAGVRINEPIVIYPENAVI